MTLAVEAAGLGRRYGSRYALRNCTLALPAGQVIGLVGPNGAGKTTLLSMVVGLLRPSTGTVRVFGHPPRSPLARTQVGFVAQDKPLYRRFTVAETLRMGGWLNPGWDQRLAAARMAQAGIDETQKVGRLSGGQRSQLALAMALGKRPRLLVLDEPVADLDPIARRDFLRLLMTEVADTGITVILSSHLLADVERTCEHLVLLSHAHVQITGDTDGLLAHHRIASGPRAGAGALAAEHTLVHADYADRQATLLLRTHGPITDPQWTVRPATLEELALAYMSAPDAGDHRATSAAAQVAA